MCCQNTDSLDLVAGCHNQGGSRDRVAALHLVLAEDEPEAVANPLAVSRDCTDHNWVVAGSTVAA